MCHPTNYPAGTQSFEADGRSVKQDTSSKSIADCCRTVYIIIVNITIYYYYNIIIVNEIENVTQIIHCLDSRLCCVNCKQTPFTISLEVNNNDI